MNYLLNYGLSYTNYKMSNVINLYNYILYLTEDKDDEGIKKALLQMKLIIGVSFYNDFLIYLMKKNNNHRILKLCND